jgi:hypothetical protein
MGYITPNTVTGSDVLTAALWNTQIRGNMEGLRKPHSCEVRLDAGIANYASNAPIAWQALNWDTSSLALFPQQQPPPPMWSAGSPTRVFIRESGLYLVTLKVLAIASPNPNAVNLNLLVDDQTFDYNRTYPVAVGSPLTSIAMTLSAQVNLTTQNWLGGSVVFDHSLQPTNPTYQLAGSNSTRLCVTRIAVTS